ncbi:MAG: polysaccharide biosynthesis tyrosine autokinase [Sphingomonadaceae bacterium]|nr:polysaccharide biosynthesis tyrosine autokinase [Sphingomonadaceae bacterium]
MSTRPQEFDAGFSGEFGEESDPLINIDLRQVMSVVNRNKLWIAGIIAATLLLGIIATFLMVPRYVATAKVLVESKADQVIEGGELQSSVDPWDTERFLQTQIDIIESRSLAVRVVRDLKLADDEAFFGAFNSQIPTEADLASLSGVAAGNKGLKEYRESIAARMIQSSLFAEIPPDSRIIPISMKTTDPFYSAKLANGYAQGYIKANLDQKFDSSAYAREYLAGQLEEARERLTESERELNQYSRAAGLIRIGNQWRGSNDESTLSVTNNSLVQLNNSASQATADRIAAQDRWETISGEPVLAIRQVLENSAIQDMLKHKTKVESELAEEKARHLDGHPTVKALKAQIAELDNRIESVGNMIRRSVYLEFKAARDEEGSLNSRVEGLRSSALNEQDSGVQYAVLKRVADTNRTLYDTLLARFNELSASAGVASNNVSLVDAAEVPVSASSPNFFLNIIMSLFIGGILAIAYVFLREHFDDEIRSPEEVEQKLGLPMLGVIPLVEGDAKDELKDSRSSIGEAYHTLVTNLMYATSAGLPKSLLITSSSEDHGKTTTATAIALDLARLGRNVLQIDADLRRPTLHMTVENGGEVGLTALLAGQIDLESALTPGPEKNLTYMTAMPIPPDPSLLLGGRRLPQLLEQLKERFDVIVIDGPPMLGLSDSAMLASHADAVLLMINASQFHRGAAKSTIRRLKLVGANTLGAVVTKFDPSSAGGEYGYYGQTYYQYEHSA